MATCHEKIQIRTERIHSLMIAVAGIGLILGAACATAPPPLELLKARKSYDLAAANPTIVEHAPVDLFEANKAIERAEAAFKADPKSAEVGHLAELAVKRVEIAEADALSRAARKEAERLERLRNRTGLEGRLQNRSGVLSPSAAAPTTNAAVGTREGMESAATALLLRERRVAERERELAAETERRIRELEATTRLPETMLATPQPDQLARLDQDLRLQSAEVAAEQIRTQALQVANQDVARTLFSLQSENDAAESTAQELRAINTDAERQALEVQTANQAAASRMEMLRRENQESEARVLEALAAAQSTEKELRELEIKNQATERAILDSQMAIEAVEKQALVHQTAAEAAAIQAKELKTGTVEPVRKQLAEQAAIERREQSALEEQKSIEAAEYQKSVSLYNEETEARRSLAAAQYAEDARAAAVVSERERPIQIIAAPVTDPAAAEAKRRAAWLEAENQRLRETNNSLVSSLNSASAAPARTTVEPARAQAPVAAVRGADEPRRESSRELVVVQDGQSSRSNLRRNDAPDSALQTALTAERTRAAELAAKQEESLASLSAARADAQRSAARTAELENERATLQEWNARLVPEGIVLTLSDLFASNKVEPRPDAQDGLRRLATLLSERSARRIVIKGHTDSSGAASYNLDLSRRRAEAVRSFLENEGLTPTQLQASGAGESEPAAPNNTAAGRKLNRRVEVTILDPVPAASGA